MKKTCLLRVVVAILGAVALGVKACACDIHEIPIINTLYLSPF